MQNTKTFQRKSHTHSLEPNSFDHWSRAKDQRTQTDEYDKSIKNHHVMRILLYCRNKNIHVYIYYHAFIYNQMHFILSIEVWISFWCLLCLSLHFSHKSLSDIFKRHTSISALPIPIQLIWKGWHHLKNVIYRSVNAAEWEVGLVYFASTGMALWAKHLYKKTISGILQYVSSLPEQNLTISWLFCP